MSTTINLTIIIQQPSTPTADQIGAAAAAAPAPASAMDQLAYEVARITAQKRRQALSRDSINLAYYSKILAFDEPDVTDHEAEPKTQPSPQ